MHQKWYNNNRKIFATRKISSKVKLYSGVRKKEVEESRSRRRRSDIRRALQRNTGANLHHHDRACLHKQQDWDYLRFVAPGNA